MEKLFKELMQLAIRQNVLLEHRDQIVEKIQIVQLSGLEDSLVAEMEVSLNLASGALENNSKLIERAKAAIVLYVQSAKDMVVNQS